jgi:hypothetical protein
MQNLDKLPKKQLVQMITLIMGFVWPKHLINMLQVSEFHTHGGTEWHAVNYDE